MREAPITSLFLNVIAYELRALGLPIICIDAHHAKADLSTQISTGRLSYGVAFYYILM